MSDPPETADSRREVQILQGRPMLGTRTEAGTALLMRRRKPVVGSNPTPAVFNDVAGVMAIRPSCKRGMGVRFPPSA